MILLDNYDQRVGDDLKASLCRGAKLRVAATSFSLHAYAGLKKELGDIDSFEFLWTAPQTGEGSAYFAPLFGGEAEVGFRNLLTQQALARDCKKWVAKKACFRLATEKAGALQSFANLEKNAGSVVYQPLSGFTADGLGFKFGSRAPALTFRFDEASIAESFQKLFGQVWDDPERARNVTANICQLLDLAAQDQPPERLYLQMLQCVFRDFLEGVDDDALPNERSGFRETLIWKKLFNFQSDAALGIIDKLERFDGCILADSVGLGKTFTALAVIKYYELRNKSVLVLCPKKLSDNWLNYNRNHKTNLFAADRFRYDVLCHTDLSRVSGESLGISLGKVNWGNYDLVVIDESHNFRNNEAVKGRETRYQRLLNKVIRDGVKTRVLMLSATPVNNHFKDLRNQIALAYEGRSENLSEKLDVGSSIEEIFRKAQAAFQKWAKSPPEQRTAAAILDALDLDFFQVLDAVTIARSRRQIQSSYDTSGIGKFPERLKPLSLRCPITTRSDALDLVEIHTRLSQLTLSIYAPLNFVLSSRLGKYEKQFDTEVAGRGRLRQTDRERSLQQLMTVNLLKRLESSVESFRLTLATLQQNLSNTLETIAAFQRSGENTVGRIEEAASKVGELDDEEQEDWDSFRTGGKVQVDLADMDLLSWRHDLENDLQLIEELLGSMALVTYSDDTKLQNLRQLILDKVAHPLNAGNRKVLVFTAFADTANYLYEALAPELLKLGLHTAKVTGSAPPRSTLGKYHELQSILTLFSPRSKEKTQSLPDEAGEIDILIATDCISEGQNLQDCDFLVNYDIHWNPVRIIQRFGRIDRIGSVNEVIQLVNYWPDISLDDYIHLKERVENRMVIADAVATADDNMLEPEAGEVAYRKEQLRRLQEEVVELEDLKTGVNITDLGLNDFRMDLLQARRDGRNPSFLPAGLFAVLPSDLQRGLVAGALFALRQIDGKATDPHNRVHPYALVYVDAQGEIVFDHTQAKVQLDLWRMACRSRTEPSLAACELFKQATNNGKDMSKMVRLLEAAVRSMGQVNEEKDLDGFFTRSRTTASRKHKWSLDDYEVIAFLPVVDLP